MVTIEQAYTGSETSHAGTQSSWGVGVYSRIAWGANPAGTVKEMAAIDALADASGDWNLRFLTTN